MNQVHMSAVESLGSHQLNSFAALVEEKLTLANVALSPFELKPYAPWIMRFLRTRSSLNYNADFQNHLSYLPPIDVLKRTFSSADEKGKATAVLDEGIRPLDGQFRKAASYSTNDDSATHDSAANASKQNPQGTAPRVLTDDTSPMYLLFQTLLLLFWTLTCMI